MGKTYIPITEANKKNILNFIGMCRMNGLEGMAEPSFSFKDNREEIVVVQKADPSFQAGRRVRIVGGSSLNVSVIN